MNRKTLINYLRLMRIHRPIPILLLLLPILIIIFSQVLIDAHDEKILGNHYFLNIIKLIFISTIGSFLVRSLGCVINDFFDKDIDAKTERAKLRPLITIEETEDKSTTSGVFILSGFLGILSLILALWLGLIPFIISIFCAFLVVLYPLTKRFFAFPQLFLGITYNFGIIIICSAVPGWLNFSSILFFLINVAWTFIYDTVYAMQDIEDDKKNQMNSTALMFEANLIPSIKTIYNLIALLLIFFSFLIYGKLIYVTLAIFYFKVKKYINNLEEKNRYQEFFQNNWKLQGIMLIGIILDLILKLIYR